MLFYHYKPIFLKYILRREEERRENLDPPLPALNVLLSLGNPVQHTVKKQGTTADNFTGDNYIIPVQKEVCFITRQEKRKGHRVHFKLSEFTENIAFLTCKVRLFLFVGLRYPPT